MTEAVLEFSRPIRVDQVSTRGIELDLTAKPSELKALADRFGLVELKDLEASLRLKLIANGTMVRMTGVLTASVVQTCVVSLEPVENEVRESFSVTFSAEAEAELGEIDLSIDEDDPPEAIVDGTIDVGEVVAEYLALALDPFPRKPGAQYVETGEQPAAPEKKANPFAVLEKFREKKP
jgi:uncharacterized metal-binding protein YceD (DUF177 family)